MRLLNAHLFTLQEYDRPPPYAILSHRWGDEELSLSDLPRIQTAAIRSMKGFAKIRDCCSQAVSEGYDYVWIDTCCIDKTSSSELSEAINSMYAWYRDAEVCFAYLQDVDGKEDPMAEGSSFRNSVWFKRGWTLQELIAPTSVVFFAEDWSEIGTKTTLADVVQKITQIDRGVLARNVGDEVSVARRMSWAAARETTRMEDRAYSLMGLFGVNMPTLYGEGSRAFIRLQQEILKVSNDHSIFAWKSDEGNGYSTGLLAESPAQFKDSSEYEQIKYPDFVKMFAIPNPKATYMLTNFGISIQLPTMNHPNLPEGVILAHLACKIRYHNFRSTCILLQQQGLKGHYVRIGSGDQHLYPWEDVDGYTVKIEELFVQESDPSFYNALDFASTSPDSTYIITVSISSSLPFVVSSVAPPQKWKQEGELVLDVGRSGAYGCVVFESTATKDTFAAILGVHNWRIWSDVWVMTELHQTAEEVHKLFEYDESTEIGSIRWKGLDRVKKPFGVDGRTIVLTTKKGSIIKDQVNFVATIKVVTHEDSSPAQGNIFSKEAGFFSKEKTATETIFTQETTRLDQAIMPVKHGAWERCLNIFRTYHLGSDNWFG